MSLSAPDRRALMRWYRSHGRHELPWRLTRDPYAVLVAEVMLQQTQVGRVLAHYERWLERWPTTGDLARASVSDVIRAWRGMGYNLRAVNLHRTCVAIVNSNQAKLPRRVDELVRLPGIGPYTAAAVASFAFGLPVAVIDTNVGRVLARAVIGAAHAKLLPSRKLRETATAILPTRNTRDHNLALMDLGAAICTARSPKCVACPLGRTCRWFESGMPTTPVAVRPGERFERTSRFARGRIVDLLRGSGPLGLDEISRTLPPGHQGHTETYLVGLERDGLVTNQHGLWNLPEVTAG